MLREQGRAGFVTIGEYTWNRPASITLPGGSTKEYVYDSLMRVKDINAGDPGGNTLLDYAYTYDRMDNILTKDTEHGDYGYNYDDLYRLTPVDNPVQDDEGFTYDGVGNRLTSLDVAGEWAYNNNNELNGYDDISYEYDANGNMIQKISGSAVISYVYNIEDRLSEVWNGEPDTGSLIAEYYYDPFGRRLRKDVEGTRTYFLYSDEGLVGEYDSTGTEIKTYGWKPGSTWSTDPLFMKIGSSYYFYHNDHLGTPQKMTGVNGGVVWKAKYEAFGKAEVGITSTITNNLRFPGQYYDGETGLHYNWNRYYDPSTGRYLSTDPLGDSINLYAYVNNSPVLWIDPWGLCETKNLIQKAGEWLKSNIGPPPNYKPPVMRTDKTNPFPPGWWKDNAFTQLYNDIQKNGIRDMSPEEKAIWNTIIDQSAQVAAQSLAYYYIHPALGISLTAFNTFMTVTGVEINPRPAN